MTSSSYLSLAAAVIFLLVLTTAKEAKGIRLDAETRASVSSSSSSSTDNPMKPSHDVVKSSTANAESDVMKDVVAASEVRAVAHKLPVFHEDYYVPNVHGPRHH
ncbi:uncharacterized protein LOC124691156 [Lolium rigidum]|uniref:uncharacterized protein LOC124691156 n=1 Tax=Lolium rigidum TaxID=89674 RepID=UPI001F5D5561|nr:uncharacterized protein LOC124691156 [Lolium rigidum]